MLRNLALNELEFPVQAVITRLKENRIKHIRMYDEALEAYRLKVKKWTSKLKDDLEQVPAEKLTLVCPEKRPTSYAEYYDQALDMLERTSQDKVKLGVVEFAQLMRDEWEWKQSFADVYATNTRM